MSIVPKYSLVCVAGLALIGAHKLLEGWAIATLWAWFVVVKFGLPSLSIAEAIGINLVLSLFVNRVSNSMVKERPISEKAVMLFVSFLLPLMSVAIGWVVKRFM